MNTDILYTVSGAILLTACAGSYCLGVYRSSKRVRTRVRQLESEMHFWQSRLRDTYSGDERILAARRIVELQGLMQVADEPDEIKITIDAKPKAKERA